MLHFALIEKIVGKVPREMLEAASSRKRRHFDEEGRLRRLPYNCSIGGLGLVGDILLVGVNGEEFDDIPGDAEDICRIVFAKWRRGIRS